MEKEKSKLKQATVDGLQKGWTGFVWMGKIIIPISFLAALVVYSGSIEHIDFVVRPVMGLLQLPSAAALPLTIGMLTNIYGAIAAMVVIPFTEGQMTLIAIFLLICHNLIQEGVIQRQSGLGLLPATIVRIVIAGLTVNAVAWFIQPETTGLATAAAPMVSVSFAVMLQRWFLETLKLMAMIFVIIMILMVIIEIMKRFDVVRHVVKVMRPVLKLMGLSENVGLLWLTAALFGIGYGGAVIVEETRGGDLTPEELTRLHLSIGINHSMIEDPALFLPFGLSPFWLWIPRTVAAMVVVHLFSLWRHVKKRCVDADQGRPATVRIDD